MAHIVRTGWFRTAYVKTEGAYRLRLLPTHRRNLKGKFLDLENAIRRSLTAFGVRMHKVGRGGFAQAVRDACADDPLTDVAAYFGLTSRRWQSGTLIDVQGRISKAGDADVRRALYEAATVMLKRYTGKTALKTWGLKLAKSKCHANAAVAVARKLVVIMHAMWRDGSEYVTGAGAAEKPAGKEATCSRGAAAAAAG